MPTLKRPAGATKSKKRLGRGPGTGNGTTAGKGTKGQNARSGGGVRPGFEGGQMPLYRRIARRGFSNYPFKREVVTVDLSSLDRSYKNGETVTLESLQERGLVARAARDAKILANGEISKKLTVSGVMLSGAARAKIEAAGGSVEDSASSAPEAAKAAPKAKDSKRVDADEAAGEVGEQAAESESKEDK